MSAILVAQPQNIRLRRYTRSADCMQTAAFIIYFIRQSEAPVSTRNIKALEARAPAPFIPCVDAMPACHRMQG